MRIHLESPEKFRNEHLSANPKIYKRVMLIGATGSGKTTFLRKILGTNPETERFPSTASNRTTTCNFESILTDGKVFKACITFLPKERIEEKIKSCAYDACEEFAKTRNKENALSKLGEDLDQNFRLKYILGDTKVEEKFKKYIIAIEKVAEEYNKNKQVLGVIDIAEKNDAEAILYEETTGHQSFKELLGILFEDVAETFGKALNKGQVYKSDGFPFGWTFETTIRKEFIDTISIFSSSYKKLWGTLVTPLVEGIRISGPFKPDWRKDALNLFIADGQGVGHTIKDESVSCKSREMFIDSDFIVIVDSAQNSMTADTVNIISSVVECGCANKIILAFTKFDTLSGDNIETIEDKREHVNHSFRQVIEKIRTEQNNIALCTDFESLPVERRLFLSNVDKVETSNDLQKTIQQFLDIIYPPAGNKNIKLQRPIDTLSNNTNNFSKQKKVTTCDSFGDTLKSNIIRYIVGYFDKWRGILNYGSPTPEPAAHWSRIKALAKRMGYWEGEEYLHLRPISDFANCLQKAVYDCISSDNSFSKEEKSKFLQKATQEINEISCVLIYANHKASWKAAYDYRGTGSTIDRREEINKILQSVKKTIEYKKDLNQICDLNRDGSC